MTALSSLDGLLSSLAAEREKLASLKRAASVKARDVASGMKAFRETAGDVASTGAVLPLPDSFAALDAQTALIPIRRM